MKLRHVLRIARWEVTKNAGGVDRRTVAVAAFALLVAGLVGPYAAGQGVAVDQGIYRVGVAADDPYYPVVASDPTFVARDPDPDALGTSVDVLIRGTAVIPADTPKGRAAVSELRSSVKRANDRRMATEANQSAAFPVLVSLQYVERAGVRDRLATGTGGGNASAGRNGGDANGGDANAGTGGSNGSGTAGGGQSGGTAGGSGTQAGSGASGSGKIPAGGGGIAGGLAGANASGTPGDIAPPFPFQSLVLAFVFVLPLNFVIQAYGSTMLGERLNRRGELLLVAPVTRYDVIGGKTLPYLAASLGVAGLIAAALEFPAVDPASVAVSLLAVAPIALLFLGATFVGAMFARSFKELTFVTVTVTVTLSSYAFVPAIFTNVNAVALISPLTIVVRNLQDKAIDPGAFAFATLPPTLLAGVLFAMGAGIYREEDLFTQRAIPLKLLDALAARIHGPASVAVTSAVVIPFVFVAELIGVAVLFALPSALWVPAILLVVVVVEEIAKSLHVYAGYAHSRFDAGLRPALVVGAASGLGFFVGEKLTLLAQLIGLPELPIGRTALLTGIGTPSIPVAVALLLAPLVLHVVTASISAVGASRSRRSYVLALVVAMTIHFAYNYTVVIASGLQ
ncbi:MAG: PrsW family intramembrane metalloprotease [Haloarculaceae archaeon]